MNAYFETSAFFKLLIDEGGSADALDLWESADRVTACRIMYPEARAALASAARAQRVTATELKWIKSRLETRWRQLEIVEVDAEIAAASGDLAEVHALRGYDAVHLACGVALEDESLAFATWDIDLRQAAQRLGLRMAPA
ncbi:MAG: PIN domain-containing protein [Actinobacteria bacterium]|nr:PIN domain-containing protein [Actinomycetota bacterium]